MISSIQVSEYEYRSNQQAYFDINEIDNAAASTQPTSLTKKRVWQKRATLLSKKQKRARGGTRVREDDGHRCGVLIPSGPTAVRCTSVDASVMGTINITL